MIKSILLAAAAALSATGAISIGSTPALAQANKARAKAPAPVAARATPAPAPAPAPALTPPAAHPSPGEIVAAAPATDWVDIPESDLLLMQLAPDAQNRPRVVIIQLMPAPFSQGWVGNIRKLAAAHWWDGLAIVRVQDNYVTQWGDPDGEDAAKARKLPAGLATMRESDYDAMLRLPQGTKATLPNLRATNTVGLLQANDAYSGFTGFRSGWPVAGRIEARDIGSGLVVMADQAFAWPVHCYGMVGVGRGMSPDTGSGAELYTVIGHAPRHLDRNIALVGRVIFGIEHLSSLPRGTGALGFYETAAERVPIVSVRMADDGSPQNAALRGFQYLSTESATFARYADARANRRDPFFIRPAGGADVCNIPVPIRRKPIR